MRTLFAWLLLGLISPVPKGRQDVARGVSPGEANGIVRQAPEGRQELSGAHLPPLRGLRAMRGVFQGLAPLATSYRRAAARSRRSRLSSRRFR